MRIRTIKPDFWLHEGLCNCSEFARLLAIALLNWADDEGYFMANPILIRGQVFPFLDDSKKIPGALLELSRVAYIQIGEDSQKRAVGRIVNFTKHQRVDKPKPSEIKACSSFQDNSKIILGIIQDPSKEEGKGREEERELEEERKREAARVSDALRIRLGSIMHRRASSQWTEPELKAFRKCKFEEEDIAAVEAFYAGNWPPQWGKNSLRSDLCTLLNNWPGEVDKARRWTPPQVSNVTAKNSTDETPWFEKPELPLNP